jgi:hypothetical protein
MPKVKMQLTLEYDCGEIYDASPKRLCDLFGSEDRDADAALIVRAVNHHEILETFVRDMCEHADEATREYALSIVAKLGERDG